MEAAKVNPGAWSDAVILYDNGWYSVVWGRFRGQSHKDLGVRWNGAPDEIGYPNARGYPQWYVEPTILHEGILWGLQKDLLTAEENPANRLCLSNIELAMRESRAQQGTI